MRGSTYRRGSGWTAHVEYVDTSGKRRQRKKGGFPTRKKAEAEVTRMLRSVELGTAVAPDRQTTEQYLLEWIDHRAAMGSLKASTVQSYRKKIRTYLIPALGHVPIQRLTATDLDRLYRDMAAKGLSARSIRYGHAIARKALADAERKGIIEHNPALRASPPSSRAARAPKFAIWSPVELGQFLAHIEGRPHAMALRFAALTGARRGEVCGLRWADVDLEAGVAAVRQAVVELDGGEIHFDTPKAHKERAVALDSDTSTRLRRHRVEQNEWRLVMGAGWRDNDLVFPAPDGSPLAPNVLSNTFRRYLASSGLPTIRLHDLRHGHGSGLVDAGYDAATVSKRLGHATTQFTLDVYVKPSAERQAAAAEAFADLVAGGR